MANRLKIPNMSDYFSPIPSMRNAAMAR